MQLKPLTALIVWVVAGLMLLGSVYSWLILQISSTVLGFSAVLTTLFGGD